MLGMQRPAPRVCKAFFMSLLRAQPLAACRPSSDLSPPAAHGTASPNPVLQAALLAMSNGRDFIMTVRPATADGDTDSQPALTVLFRPAETEQLRDGMPQIGIPAWVGGGNADARLARLEAATEPAQLRRRGSAGGASTSGDCSSKPVPAPVYYFGALGWEVGSLGSWEQGKLGSWEEAGGDDGLFC